MLDYSIIIPAYNEEAWLPSTLSCLHNIVENIAEYSGEIIIVDNNSTDNTADIARKYKSIVVFEAHRQIARARNAGANVSQGQYLIFIDAETLITRSLLYETLHTLGSGQHCGGGASMQFDKASTIYLTAAVQLWSALSILFKWAAGSYLFCLRDAFFDVGGFNEEYYVAEEVHLSLALKKWGRKHKKKMKIINQKITTSSRKMEWFAFRDLLRQALTLIINPQATKNKQACWFWYKRP